MRFGEQFLSKIKTFDNKKAFYYREEIWLYNDIFTKIVQYSNLFVNIDSGEKVATFCTNSPSYICFVISALLNGIVLVPLNPSYKKYEITEYLSKINPKMIVVSSDFDRSKLSNIEIEIKSLEDIPNMDLTHRHQQGSIIFYSSGTTGQPKPFEYTNRMFNAQLEQFKAIKNDSRFYSPQIEDVCYGCLPYFHAGGLITTLSMLWCGCTIVLNERFDKHLFLKNIEKYQVAVLFIIPMVLDILAMDDNRAYNLNSIRSIYVGSSAPRIETFQSIPSQLPSVQNLIQIYGITECGVLLSSTAQGICNGKTVGIPFPGVEIKINQDREIMVRSPTAVQEDFMKTGDLGHFNEHLELVIEGRSNEMIKIRGWQVNPIEIEMFLMNIEDIDDCAVYKRNIDGNDELVAKVVGNCERSKIFKLIADNFASYKQLYDIIYVDELPRNSSGKLLRHLL